MYSFGTRMQYALELILKNIIQIHERVEIKLELKNLHCT